MKISFPRQSWTKIVDNFTKVSKICFSIECFTANFWRFFCTYVKSYFSDGQLGTPRQIQGFQEYF